MLDDEIKKAEEMLNNFEVGEVKQLNKSNEELKTYSSYAESTRTEQEIIKNAELIGKTFATNNQIEKQLFAIAKRILDTLENLTEQSKNTDLRMEQYQNGMSSKFNGLVDDYNKSVITDAKNSLEKIEESQKEAFRDYNYELNKVHEANQKLINAQMSLVEEINSAKAVAIRDLKIWTKVACFIPVVFTCILTAACCAATFTLFSVIPKVNEMLFAFWTITGIWGVVLIGVVAYLAICLYCRKKNS